MIDFDTLSLVLTGIGLIIVLIYYSMTLRYTSKARERELIYQKFQSVSLEYVQTFNEVRLMTDWETPEEWEEKYYRTNNVEAYSKWQYITRLYEMAGLLMKQGADPEIVFVLYPAGAVISLWEQYESVIHYMREKWAPSLLDSFEYLYDVAKKKTS
jgi:hypothetical protein